MNRAIRLVAPRLRHLSPAPSRPLSLSAPPPLPALLSTISASTPLKDAVKFPRPAPAAPLVWTYHELHTHVSALCAGLSELDYTPSDALLVQLAPHSTEYAVTLLAAAQLGLRFVALSPAADPAPALARFRPRMLLLEPAPPAPDPAIVASVHSVADSLIPGLALRDARGTRGLVPLTGRPLDAHQHPYLRHVVHTGHANVRGAIAFRSLLVYSGAPAPAPPQDAPLFVDADSGKESNARDILDNALTIGKQMHLAKDHTTRNGRLVVTPDTTERSASAIMSALLHETLWVSAGPADAKAVSEAENALLV